MSYKWEILQIYGNFIVKVCKLKEPKRCLPKKAIEIFCVMDEFCNNFASECEKNLRLEDKEHAHLIAKDG